MYLYVVEGKRGGAGWGTENKSQRVKSITYDDFAFGFRFCLNLLLFCVILDKVLMYECIRVSVGQCACLRVCLRVFLS